jgi:AcrR family transcriptional regulator
LEAARDLFIQKGIQGTTIGDIAAEARVTRATIYQYFSNQSDIAWAILEEGFEAAKEAMWQPLEIGGTGYEWLAAFFADFLAHWAQHPEYLRFLAQFDTMYAGQQEVERLLEVTQRVFGGVPGPVAEVIRKGMEDGSLRSNLNPTLTAAAIMNMIIAMMVRLEAHRTSVAVEYGYTAEQIFEEAYQLLLQGLRAP